MNPCVAKEMNSKFRTRENTLALNVKRLDLCLNIGHIHYDNPERILNTMGTEA